MSEVKSYRDLEVWQVSMQLVESVYRFAKSFPAEERCGLSDQIRRAAVAIPSNIAEGNGRGSKKDYAHFLCMARGTLNEVTTQRTFSTSFRRDEDVASTVLQLPL